MCLGDWRLGRFVRSVVSTATVTNSAAIILPANNNRVGIHFGADQSIDVVVSPRESFGVDTGYWMSPAEHNLRFTLDDDGDLPVVQWFGQTVLSSATIMIVEFFLAESIITENIEKLFQHGS